MIEVKNYGAFPMMFAAKLSKSVAALAALAFVSFPARAQDSRHFTFHYSFTVKDVTPGQKLRVWLPLATSDAYQQAKVVSATGDLPLKKTRESRYGNEMLFAQAARAKQKEYHFAVDYDVVRHEHKVDLTKPVALFKPASQRELTRDLQPHALVPVTGLPAELAAKEVQGHTELLDKGRALYDYVYRTMRYDKTGDGWGHGDTLYACNAKKGNCTDFHSLFMSMARSQNIPAHFAIGFPLPVDKHSSEIAGYHCWAEFYVPKTGWVPVDISEAWKHQEKRDYFFGAHDANRVQFTVGRDLRLNPPQSGKPLNYFVYPYIEMEGKEYGNVSTAFSFADVTMETSSGTK
jgi:transglutaminase-like putative cysteine protease